MLAKAETTEPDGDGAQEHLELTNDANRAAVKHLAAYLPSESLPGVQQRRQDSRAAAVSPPNADEDSEELSSENRDNCSGPKGGLIEDN